MDGPEDSEDGSVEAQRLWFIMGNVFWKHEVSMMQGNLKKHAPQP